MNEPERKTNGTGPTDPVPPVHAEPVIAMPTQQGKGTLYARMAAVMATVGNLHKNQRNERFNFNYVSADSVSDAVRQSLGEHGLALLVNIKNFERENSGDKMTLTRVYLDITLACADTGETVTVNWIGEALDNKGADKGITKALTSATKSWMMRTFSLSAFENLDSPGNQWNWKQFWKYTREQLQLTDEEVHTALKVESVKEFKGTKDEALQTLNEYAEAKHAPPVEFDPETGEVLPERLLT